MDDEHHTYSHGKHKYVLARFSLYDHNNKK
jgi:hypothetical protein